MTWSRLALRGLDDCRSNREELRGTFTKGAFKLPTPGSKEHARTLWRTPLLTQRPGPMPFTITLMWVTPFPVAFWRETRGQSLATVSRTRGAIAAAEVNREAEDRRKQGTQRGWQTQAKNQGDGTALPPSGHF